MNKQPRLEFVFGILMGALSCAAAPADRVQPLREIPLLGTRVKARYVRLEAHPKTSTAFHLQHVEVWGNN